jgi:AcrR family transcriptional regulator
MPRSYDSRNRKQAAARTRRDIVEAALKLHWEGVTELEPLARAAGCSLPTVRKHFPTKEALFRSCTRAFAETLTMPDLAALGALRDPGRRLEASVSELCRIHESMSGYAWHSAHLRKDFPTLDAEMTGYEGLADAVAGILAPPGSPGGPVVRGLLDFLTYRALRLSGGLSPERARDELIATLRPLLPEGEQTTRSDTSQEDRQA